MIRKGRGAPQGGELNNASKITEADVRCIISRIKLGDTNKAIAGDLGITHSMVSRIRVGKSWLHIANDMDYDPKPLFERKKNV